MRTHPGIGLMTVRQQACSRLTRLWQCRIRDSSFLISQYDFQSRLTNIELWNITSYLNTNYNIKQMFIRTYRRLVKGKQET